MDRDVSIIVGNPSINAASATTKMGTVSVADFWISQPWERSTTNNAITPMGTALKRSRS